MNGTILVIQVYIIIGMILTLLGTIIIVKDLISENEKDLGIQIAKSILTGNNIRLIFLMIGAGVLIWPIAIAKSIAKSIENNRK